MEWHFNDLSLRGQFDSPESVKAALSGILALRARREDLRVRFYCSSVLSLRQATATQTLQQVVSTTPDATFRSSIMRWLANSGPFWEDSRVPNEDDLFYFEGEEVTDLGLGEASRRRLLEINAHSFSLKEDDDRFAADHLDVLHGLLESPLGNVLLPNCCTIEELENSRIVPINDWRSMISLASTRANLHLAEEIARYLRPRPFHLNLAERILQLLDVLDRIAGETNPQGGWTDQGAELYKTYFTGTNAWFSSEKTDDEHVFQFPDPDGNGTLNCPWHGKTKMGGQFRLHFEWPRPTGQRKIKVVYIGMKLTKW